MNESVNQWEQPDPSLNSLAWFYIPQQAYFLGLDIRDHSKQWWNQKKERNKLKKLSLIFWSLKCSMPTNDDETYYM